MMKLAFAFLLLTLHAAAQQTAARPVLSASPAPATAPAPVQALRPASGTAATADYVIAPEDSLEVTVWKEANLSGTFPVRPDGRISLPLVGDLMAAGFTPPQLGEDIGSRLKKYVNDPRVTVTVLAVHVDKIFLLGEVGRVGPVPLSEGMTPLQAISAAGGLTPYANAKHIYILRTVLGQQKKIPFNYKKALKTGDEQGVSLRAGDTIVVP